MNVTDAILDRAFAIHEEFELNRLIGRSRRLQDEIKQRSPQDADYVLEQMRGVSATVLDLGRQLLYLRTVLLLAGVHTVPAVLKTFQDGREALTAVNKVSVMRATPNGPRYLIRGKSVLETENYQGSRKSQKNAKTPSRPVYALLDRCGRKAGCA